jgi:hypothetical protein
LQQAEGVEMFRVEQLKGWIAQDLFFLSSKAKKSLAIGASATLSDRSLSVAEANFPFTYFPPPLTDYSNSGIFFPVTLY